MFQDEICIIYYVVIEIKLYLFNCPEGRKYGS